MIFTPDCPEHFNLVVPYYYAHFRTNEIVEILRQKEQLLATTDQIKAVFLRLQRASVPKYNRNRILPIAMDELKQITNYGISFND